MTIAEKLRQYILADAPYTTVHFTLDDRKGYAIIASDGMVVEVSGYAYITPDMPAKGIRVMEAHPY